MYKDDLPKQKNGVDCGVFAILYGFYAVAGYSPDFEQSHIDTLRQWLQLSLIHGEFRHFDYIEGQMT